MQERELIKAGILGGNEQDVKQLGGRPRFIKPQTNMNTDNTNNSTSLSNNATNTNNTANNSNTTTNTNNQPPALRCPRCDSANTKFCYYNNYSLLQPRYFCKSCRRYWTKGGALRNVPVGGGCRKNKRITSRQRVGGPSDLISPSSSTSFLSHPHLADHHPPPFSPFGDHALNTRPPHPLGLLNHPHDHSAPHNLLYFNLPPNDSLMTPNQSLLPPPPVHSAGHHELHSPSHAAGAAGLFSRQLASYLPSSIASQYLSNVSSGSLPLHNLQGFNHDYLSANPAPAGAADHHQQLMQHSSFNASMNLTTTQAAASTATPAGSAGHDQTNMGFKAFSLPFDNLNLGADDHHQHWATNKIIPLEQKLLTDQKLNQISNAAAMENQANMEGPSRVLYTQLRPHTMQSPKAEAEGWPPTQHETQLPSSSVAAGDQAANYWNGGGWNDMSGYNPGADHPFM